MVWKEHSIHIPYLKETRVQFWYLFLWSLSPSTDLTFCPISTLEDWRCWIQWGQFIRIGFNPYTRVVYQTQQVIDDLYKMNIEAHDVYHLECIRWSPYLAKRTCPHILMSTAPLHKDATTSNITCHSVMEKYVITSYTSWHTYTVQWKDHKYVSNGTVIRLMVALKFWISNKSIDIYVD